MAERSFTLSTGKAGVRTRCQYRTKPLFILICSDIQNLTTHALVCRRRVGVIEGTLVKYETYSQRQRRKTLAQFFFVSSVALVGLSIIVLIASLVNGFGGKQSAIASFAPSGQVDSIDVAFRWLSWNVLSVGGLLAALGALFFKGKPAARLVAVAACAVMLVDSTSLLLQPDVQPGLVADTSAPLIQPVLEDDTLADSEKRADAAVTKTVVAVQQPVRPEQGLPANTPDTEAPYQEKSESLSEPTIDIHSTVMSSMANLLAAVDVPDTVAISSRQTPVSPATPKVAIAAPKAAVRTSTKLPKIHERIVEQGVSEGIQEWIDEAPDNYYSLQIYATSQLNAAVEFIAEHKLQNAHYFRQRSPSKRWYKVVVGQFESIAEAKLALDLLPDNARRFAPWVRTVASIRDDMGLASQQLSHLNP